MGGVAIRTLGDYWQPSRDERTEIGELVHRAKDRGDPRATTELAERFASLADTLPRAAGGQPRLVVPVPSGPVPAGDGDRPHLAGLLASSLAAAGAGEYCPHLVVKSNPTPRLRGLSLERRPEVVALAGYRASGSVAGHLIVLVDDVVQTGTTLNAVSSCLRAVGAAEVTAAAAARTRFRLSPP